MKADKTKSEAEKQAAISAIRAESELRFHEFHLQRWRWNERKRNPVLVNSADHSGQTWKLPLLLE